MTKYKTTKKKKNRKLWYGWAVTAAKQFKCSTVTIQNKYKKNDLDLLTWISEELKTRKNKASEALNLKKEITRN